MHITKKTVKVKKSHKYGAAVVAADTDPTQLT
jgi:hypothetical protein